MVERRVVRLMGKKQNCWPGWDPMKHDSAIYTGYYFLQDERTWVEWKKKSEGSLRQNHEMPTFRVGFIVVMIKEETMVVVMRIVTHTNKHTHTRTYTSVTVIVILTPLRPLIGSDLISFHFHISRFHHRLLSILFFFYLSLSFCFASFFSLIVCANINMKLKTFSRITDQWNLSQ